MGKGPVLATTRGMHSEPLGPSLADKSRVALLTRRAKLAALGTHRLMRWLVQPEQFGRPRWTTAPGKFTRYSARIPLRSRAPVHPLFEEGKLHNVRLATPAFDGVTFSGTRPFSFWRTLGRVTAEAGYRHGMELAGGCIVPAIGGGLCLLSRALFQAAVLSGFDVLERHGHSMAAVEPPPGVPFGIDATVLWPQIDLRFAPRAGTARLSARIRNDVLLLDVQADSPLEARLSLEAVDERVTLEPDGRVRHNRILRHWLGASRTDVVAVNRTRLLTEDRQRRNCMTCDESGCHARVVPPGVEPTP